MSLLELKQRVSRLSQRERLELQAYMTRLKQGPPAWKRATAKKIREMKFCVHLLGRSRGEAGDDYRDCGRGMTGARGAGVGGRVMKRETLNAERSTSRVVRPRSLRVRE